MARKDVDQLRLGTARGFAKKTAKRNPAVEMAAGAAFDAQGKPTPAVHGMLLRAVEVQRPLVLANLRRLRRRHPNATAFQLHSTPNPSPNSTACVWQIRKAPKSP